MAKRKIVVFYNGDSDNVEIADTDYAAFYKELDSKVQLVNDFHIDSYLCRTAATLLDKLSKLSDPKQEDAEEIYLHFSSHGTTKGIPYGDWILENSDLVNFLGSPRFKFCFFSSCSAGELVDLANLKNVPIVLGTKGESKVQNDFAIKFQTRFYDELLKKQNFWEAYKLAGSHANNDVDEKVVIDEPIVRGEMGVDDLGSDKLNDLQIIFAEEHYVNWRMVPRNFIDRINQEGSSKPQIILWADDPLNLPVIIKKFEKKGYSEIIDWYNLPSEELDLLNEPAEWSSLLSNPHKTLVIHLTKREAIDKRIQDFLSNEKIYDQENFKVGLCLYRVSLSDCISNSNLLNILQEKSTQFLSGKMDVTDFLEEDEKFITLAQKQNIPFVQRKKITFSFDTPPVRKEMDGEVPKGNLLRVFIGHSKNENLFHFLINRLIDDKNLSYPVLVTENQISDHNDLLKELTNQTKRILGSDKNLPHVLATGGMMVIKLSGIDSEKRPQLINDFLQQLKAGWAFEDVSRESFVFFLFDGPDLHFPGAGEKVHVCKFSTPDEISEETITAWRNQFPETSFIDKSIIEKVKEISDAIDPAKFKECCPSRAIEFVCDKLELPHKQIIGI